MDGWTKVILATCLMVVALAAFNYSIWRRLREATRLARLQEERERAEAEAHDTAAPAHLASPD